MLTRIHRPDDAEAFACQPSHEAVLLPGAFDQQVDQDGDDGIDLIALNDEIDQRWLVVTEKLKG